MEIGISFIQKPEEVIVTTPPVNAFEIEVGEVIIEGGPSKRPEDKKKGKE